MSALPYEVQVAGVNASTLNSGGLGPWSDLTFFDTSLGSVSFDGAAATLSVAESAAVDAAVGTITATYAGTVTYSLSDTTSDSGDAAFFAVDAATGAITVAQALDYETKTSYAVTLTATDSLDTSKMATHALTISVSNVVEPPAKPDAPTFGSITATGATVTWVAPATTSKDAASKYQVRHRATGSSPGAWTTSAELTALTLALTSLTGATEYEVQVAGINTSTTDSGLGEWSDSATFYTLSAAVAFPADAPDTLSVAEDTAVGAAVGTVAVINYGGTVTYSLSDTTSNSGDAAFFAVDANTGAITVATALDHETKPSLAVTLTATDSNTSSNTATHALTITVTDVVEPPAKPAVPTVGAITMTGATVTWAAPATTSREAAVTYVVRHQPTGTSPADWTISAGLTALTYTLTGLTATTEYEVQVVGLNTSTINSGLGEWSDSATFTTLTPIVAFPANALASVSLSEGAALLSAVATIAIGPYPSAVTYSLSDTTDNSGDAAFFAVDAATGAITVAQALDFESQPVGGYKITLTATDSNNASKFDTHDLTVSVWNLVEPPAKPDTPDVTSDTATTATVIWTAPATTSKDAATKYQVRHRATGSSPGAWTTSAELTTLTYNLTGLTAATEYEVQVVGINVPIASVDGAGGTGEWSDSATFHTQAATLAFPDNASPTLSVAEDTAVGAAVGTVAVINYAGNVAYSLSDTTPSSGDAAFFAVDSNGLIAVAQALDYETKTSYAVTLTAVDSDDNTKTDTHALTITVTNVVEPPAKPAVPTVTAITTAAATVTWTAPATTSKEAAASYVVRYKPTSDSTWEESDAQTALTYDLTGLDAGTQYDVAVVAINASTLDNGRSAASDSAAFTTDLAAPTLARDAGGNLKITWQASVRTADNYRVRYSTDGGTSWTPVDLGTTTTYTLSSPPFGVYIAQVLAVYGGTDGAWSDSGAPAHLLPKLAKPDVVQDAAVFGDGRTFMRNKVQVSWADGNTHPVGATVSYQVRYSSNSGQSWTSPNPVTDKTQTLSAGISAGQTYVVQVAVRYGSDTGPWSDTSNSVTVFPNSDPPTLGKPNLSISNDGNGDLVVTAVDSNTPPAGAKVEYQVRYRQSGSTSGGGQYVWTDVARSTEKTQALDLTPATTYDVRVALIYNSDRGAWSASSSLYLTSIPSLAKPTVEEDADGRIKVSWTDTHTHPNDVDVTYEVRYFTNDDDFNSRSAGTTAGSSIFIPKPVFENKYKAQVAILYGAQRGAWSPVSDQVTKQINSVPQMAKPVLSDQGGGVMRITWVPPADIPDSTDVVYVTEVSTDGGLTWERRLESRGVGVTHKDYSTVPGKTYTARVRVYYDNSPGAWSESADSFAVAALVAPTKPVLHKVSGTQDQIGASWTLSSADPRVNQYRLEYSSDNGATWSAGGTSTGLAHAVGPLSPGTPYVIRVRSVQTATLAVSGWSPASDPLIVLATETRYLQSTASGSPLNAAITLSSGGPYNAGSFSLLAGAGDSDSFAVSPSDSSNTAVVVQTSSTLSPVKDSYVVTVRAVPTAGTAREFDVFAVVTLAPASPTVAVDATTLNTLNVSWDAVTLATPLGGYEVRHRKGSTGSFTTSAVDKAATTYALTGLDQRSEYEVRLRYFVGTGASKFTSAESATATATTLNVLPTFDADTNSFTLVENTAAGTAVGTIAATDPGDTLTYELQDKVSSSGDSASFAVDGDGQITVATGASLNYESQSQYQLVLKVTDPASASIERDITIAVTDVAEAPVVSAGDDLQVMTGATVTLLGSASDEDAGTTLVYSWTAPAGITLSNPAILNPTFTAPNTPTPSGSPLEFTLTVMDGTGAGVNTVSDRVQVTVLASVTNSPPTFGASTYSTSIAENVGGSNLSPVSLPITWSVTDSDSDPLSYAITSGNPSGHFSIDASGLSYAGPGLDHEVTPTLDLTVLVADTKGGTGTAAVTVTVTDVLETPGGITAAPTVTAVTSTTLTFTWAVPTNTGPALSYEPEARVKGQTAWVSAPVVTTNTATITGLTPNTEYEFRVRADNGEAKGAYSAVATVTTGSNSVPTFDQAIYAIDIWSSDTVNAGDTIATIAAVDTDPAHKDNLTYRFPGVHSLFRVDNSGNIIVKAGVDLDANLGTYSLTLIATDPLGEVGTATVNVAVLSRVDYKITSENTTDGIAIDEGTYNEQTESIWVARPDIRSTVAEAGWKFVAGTPPTAVVPTVTLTASHAGNSIFALTTANRQVTVDAATDYTANIPIAVLNIKAGTTIDFEKTPSADISLDLTWPDNVKETLTGTITFVDLAEPPPPPVAPIVAGKARGAVTVSWVTPANAPGSANTFPDVTGVDMQYCLTSVDCPTNGGWTDGVSGSTATQLDVTGLTTGAEYVFRVRATNPEGMSPWSPTVAWTISSVNSNPEFPSTEDGARSINELAAGGATVGAPVAATDADGDPITYSLSGAAAAAFTIDAGSGQISLGAATSLDRAVARSYIGLVTASDSYPGSTAATQTVTITVTANATPSLSISDNTQETLTEDDDFTSAVDTGIAFVYGDADGDEPVLALSADSDSRFELDTTFTGTTGTGAIRIKAGSTFSLDQNQRFLLTITIADHLEPSKLLTSLQQQPRITVDFVSKATVAPLAPSLTTPTDTSVATYHTSLSATWTAPDSTNKPDITGYDLQYCLQTADCAPSGTGWTDGPQNVSGATALITGLTQDTAYRVRVRSKNPDASPYSPASALASTNPGFVFTGIADGKINRAVPERSDTGAAVGAPAAVASFNNTHYSLPVSPAIAYSLQTVAGKSNAGNFVIEAATGQIKIGASPPSLQIDDGPYEVRVTATQGAVDASVTVVISVSNVADPPSPPQNVQVVGGALKTATATWQKPTSGGDNAAGIDYDVDTLTYSLEWRVAGSSDALQTATGVTGLTHTVTGLKGGGTYSFTVYAHNANSGQPASRSEGVLATATTLVNNPPSFSSVPTGEFKLPEGVTSLNGDRRPPGFPFEVGTEPPRYTLLATDIDTGDQLTFRILSTTPATLGKGNFRLSAQRSVGAATGVTLEYLDRVSKDGEDYEAVPNGPLYKILVEVSDGEAQAVAEVKVRVTDVDEAPVVELSDVTAEAPRTGTRTRTLAPDEAYDPEGKAVTYQWAQVTDSSGSTVISGSNSLIDGAVKTTRTVDVALPALAANAPDVLYYFRLTATDPGTNSAASVAAIRLISPTISDNPPPTFGAAAVSFSLAEVPYNLSGAAVPGVLGTIPYTDTRAQFASGPRDIAVSIQNPSAEVAQRFKVENTGSFFQNTQAVELSYTGIGEDYEEDTKSYTIEVRVQDEGGGSATKTVTVNLANLQDYPDTPSLPTVTARGTDTISVSWSKPATRNRKNGTGDYYQYNDFELRYRPTGASASWETQAVDAGVTAATLTGLMSNTPYEVQVRGTATDQGNDLLGGLSTANWPTAQRWSPSALAVTLAAAPPVFAAGAVTRTIAENTSASSGTPVALGAAVTATNPEGVSGTITYSLAFDDAADQALFSIDATTGAISSIAPLDFEAKSQHSFDVIAERIDNSSASKLVQINVTDVSEPTAFLLNGSPTNSLNRTVPENSVAPTAVGAPIVATDDDTKDGIGALTYTLANDDACKDRNNAIANCADYFEINGATGQITVKSGFTVDDYDLGNNRAKYAVKVTATDASANPAPREPVTITVFINITNVTEPPVFIDGLPMTVEVPENAPRGAQIGTFTARNPDGGGNPVYNLNETMKIGGTTS